MRPPLRIAILECDTPVPETDKKYGGYGGVFTALIKASADSLGEPGLSSKEGLVLSSFDVVTKQEYPNLEDIDAVLLSGSKHNSFDDDPWIIKLVEFTQKVLDQDRVRLIGVCYGHQIIGRALGVKVGRGDRGWETSVCLVKLSNKGQELFKKDMLSIHQMHRDIVYGFPEGVTSLGSSPVCENQGMYARARLISVQGHPEFTEAIMRELLEVRKDQGLWPEKDWQAGMDRVANHHDGVVIGAAFLRFLLED